LIFFSLLSFGEFIAGDKGENLGSQGRARARRSDFNGYILSNIVMLKLELLVLYSVFN